MTVIESVLASDDPVGQAIGGIARVSAVQPNQTLAELGLDSLGLVELAIALEEKTGKAVDEDALRLEMTVDEVRAVLAAAPALVDGAGARAARPAAASASRRRSGPTPGDARSACWPRRSTCCCATPARRSSCSARSTCDGLPDRVILAGTHRSFADMPLVRYALARSGADGCFASLITANAASRASPGCSPGTASWRSGCTRSTSTGDVR